jgi:hypothetical protein
VSCPNADRCPLYGLFTSDTALMRWRRLYCDSARHTSCERYQRKASGEPVPTTLMPNGKMLPVLG